MGKENERITFPYKLWRLINNAEENGIYWNSGGKTFSIEKKLFSDACLNENSVFKTRKLESIFKQLSSHSFELKTPQKISLSEVLIYQSANFRRGQPDLLRKISRKQRHSHRLTSTEDGNPIGKSSKPNKKRVNKSSRSGLFTARRRLQEVLKENLEKFSRTHCDSSEADTDTESQSSLQDFEISVPRMVPPPLRQDPNLLMWNGSSLINNQNNSQPLQLIPQQQPNFSDMDVSNNFLEFSLTPEEAVLFQGIL